MCPTTVPQTSGMLGRSVRNRVISFDGQKGVLTDWDSHTYAKLIEIQKNYLQKIHGPHELGCHMECNDTLRGSELGPHLVLGPNNQNLVPWDQKKFAQKILYTKLVGYHVAILWGFEA